MNPLDPAIASAIQLVVGDDADTTAKSVVSEGKDAAAANAAHEAEVALNDKTAAITKQNADLTALQTLLDQRYRLPNSTPVAAPPAGTPTP